MTDAIGRADYELGADRSKLQGDLRAAEGDIARSGQRAESAAQTRASSAVAKFASISKAGVMALSGAVTGAMAIAARGAMQMEQAQADFQAETGASAEEAKRFGQAVNDMSAHNVQSLEEIVSAGTKVRADLGLTGDEADALTQRFLTYARATKQDAAGAVLAFDDILDNWNLTAADAQGVMDRLIVSHQRYGGSIEDNQKTLAQLAPALQAANFEIDDAIGLLGLFGAKGLDANQGAAAFAKALTKVESPEELQRLIDDISETEDDFQRARKAADLFGARAGAKLANALSGTHIRDFNVSMEDAAGATDKARDALDSTFGSWWQLKMNEATAALRGLGMEFGPAGSLITAIASAAPLLAGPLKAIGAAMGVNVAAGMIPKIAAALTAAALPGGALALAAAAITLPIAINFVMKDRNANSKDDYSGELGLPRLGMTGWDEFQNLIGMARTELRGMRDELGLTDEQIDRLAETAAAAMYGTTVSVHDAVAQAAAGWRDIQRIVADANAAGMTTGEAYATGVLGGVSQSFAMDSPFMINRNHWLRQAEELGSETGRKGGVVFRNDWGKEAGQGEGPMEALRSAGWEKNLISGMQDSAIASGVALNSALRSILPGAFAVVPKAAADAGDEAGDELWSQLVIGLRHGETPVKNAMADLRWALENPLAGARLRARIEGALTSEELAKGLRSRRPWIRAEAERAKAELIRQWELATGKSWDYGKSIDENLARGMRRNKPLVTTAGGEVRDAAIDPVSRIPGKATTYGTNYGKNLAAGMRSQISAVQDAAGALAKAGSTYNRISSPAKAGPWSEGGGPEGWGIRYGQMLARGMLRARGEVAAAAGALAGTGAISGFTLDTSATQTVRHQHGGTVQVELSPSTISAARQQGASWEDVGRMVSAADLGALLIDAERDAGSRFTSVRRG